MMFRDFCKKRKYFWSAEVERKYKFLLRSAKIKKYNQSEIDTILIDVLQKNKRILLMKKRERLEVAIDSVEVVLKNQIRRK